ncbi:MAG: hypothetical protein ACNS62_10475 [Candidatus Cyclobacteriaceae bacterium M3_2C_046]
MTFFPYKKETLVLPHEAGQLENLLVRYVKPARQMSSPPLGSGKSSEAIFNGCIAEGKFRISMIIKVPQNFLPLITGRIEATSRGCLVFLHYQLFYSTLLFIMMWSIICLMMALLFFLAYKIYLYGIIALIAGLINYGIALVNFNMYYKRSRLALLTLIRKH